MIAMEDLQEYLGVQDCTSSEEWMLELLEEAAVAFVEGETGQYFGPVISFTQVVDGSGQEVLWLDYLPTTFTSISYRTAADLSAWTAYDSTDYEQDGRKLFRLGAVWPRGRRNLRVIYDAGYAAGEEPSEVRQAVLSLVSAAWKRKSLGPFQSETIGDYQYTLADASEVDEKVGLSPLNLLAKWRKPQLR